MLLSAGRRCIREHSSIIIACLLAVHVAAVLTCDCMVGIAVGAGELGEEQAKDLAETKEELRQALAALQTAREENQELRARMAREERAQEDL